MIKSKNKIISVVTSVIMAVNMSASICAVTDDSCPPHLTQRVLLGIKQPSQYTEHDYLAEIRTDADGKVTNIYKTCEIRRYLYRYAYKCKKCGMITEQDPEVKLVHSACGKGTITM